MRNRRTVPCLPASVKQIRSFIGDFLARHGVEEDRQYDLLVAVEEAAANACRHGCSPEPTSIEISCGMSGFLFEVEIADQGGGFDPSALDMTTPPDPFAIGGRGLFLMHRLMDHVEIDSSERGTRVRMTAPVGTPSSVRDAEAGPRRGSGGEIGAPGNIEAHA